MKKWTLVISLLLLGIIVFFVSGYRLTALAAAKSNSMLPKDAELIEQFDTRDSFVFLFKSDGEQVYRTVLTEKFGMVYSSRASTFIPYNSDQIETIGWISFTNENDSATLLSVISNDDEVAYIEVGVAPDVERKQVKTGERVDFWLPISTDLNNLNPVALNKDGETIYYYGYPEDANVHSTENLKWYPIEK